MISICKDSGFYPLNQTSGLKKPKTEKNKRNPCNFQKYFVSLQRQNISFDYAAECGEQGLIDTAPFKEPLFSGFYYFKRMMSLQRVVGFLLLKSCLMAFLRPVGSKRPEVERANTSALPSPLGRVYCWAPMTMVSEP